MNLYMVKRLILKDWYLQRWAILGALAAGAITLVIIASGGKAAFILGLIAFVTVLIATGAQLAMATIVMERKEQTLSFVMSLPISYREYTAAKILGNLLIFLIPWIALVFSSFALIALAPAPGIPHGLVPYVALMSVEILMSTCLIAVVALITESQGWTIGAIMVGNLTLNGFGYYFAHIPSIAKGMGSPTVQWSPAASALLLAEFATIALMLGLTFFFQARKKDFL
jgi:ABC-2 type transport system permease protein